MSAKQLKQFQEEVLSKGMESTLPANLSDEWLETLGKQADYFLSDTDTSDIDTDLLLTAMLHIVTAKNVSKCSIELGYEVLEDYTRQYAIELAMETVSRNTDVTISRPTINTIFTNRDLESWIKPN